MHRVTTEERRARLVRRHLLDPGAAGLVGRRGRRGPRRAPLERRGHGLPLDPRANRGPRSAGDRAGALRRAHGPAHARDAADALRRPAGRAPARAGGLHATPSPRASGRGSRAGWRRRPESTTRARGCSRPRRPRSRPWRRRVRPPRPSSCARCRSSRRRSRSAPGRWALQQSAGSRVLPLLAAQGRLLRGRPRGTWISGQYRWVPTQAWLGERTRPTPAARHGPRSSELAPGERARGRSSTSAGGQGSPRERFARRSPRSARSRSSSTGRRARARRRPRPGREPPSRQPRSSRRSTRRRWAGRSGSGTSGRTAPVLFDRNGNAGPTVWWDGRVVGGWSQRGDGEIVSGCSRTSARRPSVRSSRRRHAWPRGSATYA